MTHQLLAAGALLLLAACTREAPPPTPGQGAAATTAKLALRELSQEEDRHLTMHLHDLHAHRVAELAELFGLEQTSLELVVETGEDGAVRQVSLEKGAGLERFLVQIRKVFEGSCQGECPALGRGKVFFSLKAEGPRPPYSYVAVSPDGTTLARVRGPPANRLEIYDTASGTQVVSGSLPDSGFVAAIALTDGPGAKVFVLGSVRLIVEVDGPEKAPLSVPGENFFGVQDVAVGAQGKAVLVAQKPHSFMRGPGSALPPQRGAIVSLEDGAARPVPKDVRRVEGAALSADLKWLVETGAELRVWDLATGKNVFPGKAPASKQAFFSADGKTLFAAVAAGESERHSLDRYQAGTWARLDGRPIPARKETLLEEVSRDGQLAFYGPGGTSGTAEIIDLTTGKLAYQFEIKEGRADVVLIPGGGAFTHGLSGYQMDVAVHSLAEKRRVWTLERPPPMKRPTPATPVP